MKSKAQIGQEYRLQTLLSLARLGYATTRQIAMCLFGGSNDSDRKQASRTIRRLLDQGFVVEKRDGGSINGERMIALTRKGANAINDQIALSGQRIHARDLLRHAHAHRTACNSVWAALHRGLIPPGFTELEIRSGDAPHDLALFRFSMEGEIQQKIPDLLLTNLHGDYFDKPVWVEVENAYRGQKDFTKLISFLRAILGKPNPPISAVWFVVTADGAKSIFKRLQSALAHGPESGWPRQIKELDEVMLKEKIKIFTLDGDTLKLTPLMA